MLHIVDLGLSYKTSPLEIRERLSFNHTNLDSALKSLKEKANVEECAILSTCNRTEIYAVSSNAYECLKDIRAFLSEFHQVPQEDFESGLYELIGESAVKHLLRVSSSLDSLVIGEPQILGQVKTAYKSAHYNKSTSLVLNRLFHYAFTIAKKVRYSTKIGTQAVSISFAAVELAKRIFDDLPKRKTLLVGTGEMGELAARHLISAGTKELIIASRTLENSQQLAQKLNGSAIRIEEVPYYLSKVDIVITATGSSDYIIKRDNVHDALKLRKNEPMFMIDIAVPRDIDPRVEKIENVYLYDIDDLKGVLDENMNNRKEHAKKAEEIVQAGVVYFQSWLDSLKVVPTIISLKKRFEEIKVLELEKALSKLDGHSERDKQILEAMAAGIIGKILHNPMTKLKREASSTLGAFYSNSVQELFELDSQFDLLEDIEESEDDNEASA